MLAVGGLLLTTLPACRSKSEPEPAKTGVTAPAAPKTAAGQTAQDFVQARDQFVADMNARLVVLDGKIDVLEKDLAVKAAEGNAAATAALNDAIAKLAVRRAEARLALERGRQASETGWEQFKRETSESMQYIEDSYKEVAAQFQK